ncbi:MAG: MFS transporter [Planctomycetota bacterium]
MIKSIVVVKDFFGWHSTKKLFEARYRIFSASYFAQGLVFGIIGIAFPIYLQKQFNLTMSELVSMTILIQFPWFIKPFWGFISDHIPVFGRRRIPYIIICSFIVFSSSITIGSVVNTYWMFVFAAFCLNLGFGFTDVACDAHGVDMCKKDNSEEGIIQAIMWETRSFGACLSGIGGGILIGSCGEKFTFLLMSLAPITLCIVAFWSLKEEDKNVHITKDWGKLFKKSSYEGSVRFLIAAAIFLFIFNMAPVFSPSSMQYFMGKILGYSPFMRGIISALGAFGGFLGLRYYREYIQEVDIRSILKLSLLIGAGISLTYVWAVYNYSLLLFIFIIGAFVSMIGFVCSMRVAVRACPKGIEGTVFAIMMSLCNIGSMFGAWVGGKIFDFFGIVKYIDGEVVYQDPGHGFTWMVIISSAMSLIPLLFLRLLKEFKTNNVKAT